MTINMLSKTTDNLSCPQTSEPSACSNISGTQRKLHNDKNISSTELAKLQQQMPSDLGIIYDCVKQQAPVSPEKLQDSWELEKWSQPTRTKRDMQYVR